ncbi:MAG: ISAzo13 family transposase [Actinobacteria bacterium]|nr:ISAzo13 family transposase [Actinomycetota bacterium]
MPTSFTVTDEDLSFFFEKVLPHLDERQRKIITGATARALGHGGVKAVAGASGLSLSTVQHGALAVDAGIEPSERIRAPGGGRPRAEKAMPGVVDALDQLVEPESRGDPECVLRWTTESTRNLADELTEQGFEITHSVVARLLADMGYSLQAARKSAEGSDHPDRDAQFRYLANLVQQFRAAEQPVISVDAKKKELIGNFAPAGRQWRPAGQPVETNTHDFPDEELGKAVPYGVYDVADNTGWVSVGASSDTAEFAVSTIRRWWNEVGSATYPKASQLLITADSGGSNSSRSRLWKRELAAFAQDAGLDVVVCHFPPGTSKWNKIEHRLFSHISMNWRGQVLESREVVVNLIAGTTTRTGLTVRAELDPSTYQKGIKVTDREMKLIPIIRHEFHGDWNYTIKKSTDEPAKESK